ncbi:PAS domain-containing protein, partial [Aliivibrio sifiae]
VLSTLPDPVFSISLKGKIDNANQAVASLFNLDKETLIGQPASLLLPDFNITYWLEESHIRQRESMEIEGVNYVMEIMPVYITDDDNASILASAVVIIKPSIDSQQARPFYLNHLILVLNILLVHQLNTKS